MKLSEVKNGGTFKIGNIEFIKFYDRKGNVAAVTKDIIFKSSFGENNNFKESEILKKLEREFLPKIAQAIGNENIIEFETDLLTLDGLKDYKTIKSKISLPTFDFYRANRKIFGKHKIGCWWWLSTANGSNGWWVSCVAPSGRINDDSYDSNFIGVRPFCIFDANIFVSE